MKRILSGIALALLCVPALFAQTPEAPKPAMMPDCAAMMQQHETMQKHMAEMNAKLQPLVGEMNAAKGSARIDKTAAVVNELVAQRAMMQKEMMEAGMNGMSMSDCPMMKESKKTSAAPAGHKH